MTTPQWWREAICYQIYPRSFADTNGDGIGDLPGIIDKLDYLAWLGVTALWISPFYPSAQLDWGYDISDYTGVHPEYGTLADVDRLIAAAHARGIRILLDMVLNHTSDQHDWFQQSKSSRANPYRDWYIWRDPQPDGSPPNDWESIFGGSAWEWDEATGQYYYHFFFKEQPDLNWRNPAVKAAMFAAMRFWLDRGVDGFRLDAIGSLYEDEQLTNSDTEGSLEEMFIHARSGVFENWDLMEQKMRHQMNLPEIHALLSEMRALVDSYGDRVLVGESADEKLCGPNGDQLHSVFNFELTDLPLDARRIHTALGKRLACFPTAARDCNTLSNHDRRRSYSVHADGQHDAARALVALALITLIQGTPVYYYGEEIGMTNLEFTALDQLQDAFGIRYYHILRERYGVAAEEAFNTAAAYMGRDGCRTPMQWSSASNAGFTTQAAQTWLPVHPNYAARVNVAEQQADPDSFLTRFRELIHIRQQHPALRDGTMRLADADDNALVFWREARDGRCVVALNLAASPLHLSLEELGSPVSMLHGQEVTLAEGQVVLGSYGFYIGQCTT